MDFGNIIQTLVSSLVSAFVGGGLVWIFTLKPTVKTANLKAKVSEVESLEKSVSVLRKEISSLHEQLNSYREIKEQMCKECMFFDFYHQRKNEIDNKINNKT